MKYIVHYSLKIYLGAKNCWICQIEQQKTAFVLGLIISLLCNVYVCPLQALLASRSDTSAIYDVVWNLIYLLLHQTNSRELEFRQGHSQP